MNNSNNDKKKGIFLVTIGAIILSIAIYVDNISYIPKNMFKEVSFEYARENTKSQNEITVEDVKKIVLESTLEEINYWANIFQIDFNVLYNKLYDEYYNLGLDQENININKIIIDYLFTLEEIEPSLFTSSNIPCDKDSNYILSLINFYSSIYGNVDYSIAASIAHIESGYSSPTMLRKNNIFGGMSNGKLIKYKSIEYGVLKYIKLLSESYFGNGLDTIEKIGIVYNPTFTENGTKIAKPEWVSKVKSTKVLYENYTPITNFYELTLQ